MSNLSSLSENVQMYLVSILRLGKDGQPVPLSELAATLDVSPVSVNQMCRKLQSQGLVSYMPYRGVSITAEGERLAGRILRRHRLWEVFLVEHLRMTSEAAHETACRLEHATSEALAERLAAFLSYPQVNPEGAPIPASSGQFSTTQSHPLVEMETGQRGHCIRCTADEASCAFLIGQGLRPGVSFQVVAAAPGSLLLEINGRRIAVARSLATAILVEIELEQGPRSEFPASETG